MSPRNRPDFALISTAVDIQDLYWFVISETAHRAPQLLPNFGNISKQWADTATLHLTFFSPSFQPLPVNEQHETS